MNLNHCMHLAFAKGSIPISATSLQAVLAIMTCYTSQNLGTYKIVNIVYYLAYQRQGLVLHLNQRVIDLELDLKLNLKDLRLDLDFVSHRLTHGTDRHEQHGDFFVPHFSINNIR